MKTRFQWIVGGGLVVGVLLLLGAGTIEDSGIFQSLKLGGRTNLISDDGSALTYNGTHYQISSATLTNASTNTFTGAGRIPLESSVMPPSATLTNLSNGIGTNLTSLLASAVTNAIGNNGITSEMIQRNSIASSNIVSGGVADTNLASANLQSVSTGAGSAAKWAASGSNSVQTNGYVGIGTNGPTAPLHVVYSLSGTPQGLLLENYGSGSTFLSLHSQDAGGDAVVGWGIEPTKASWHLGAANADGDLKIFHNSFGSGGLVARFYAAGTVEFPFGVTITGSGANLSISAGNMSIGTGKFMGDTTRTILRSMTNGDLTLSNHGETDFGLLSLGGRTSSFPAIKRSGATIQVRLADDSGDADLSSANLTVSGAAIKGGRQTLIAAGGTPQTIFYISVPNTNSLSGDIIWKLFATDGTDTQAQTGHTLFDSVAKGTTVTAGLTSITNAAVVTGGTTLSGGLTANVTTNNVLAIQATLTTSLTTTNMLIKWRIQTPSVYSVTMP